MLYLWLEKCSPIFQLIWIQAPRNAAQGWCVALQFDPEQDDTRAEWVAFHNKRFAQSYDLKAAWRLKTFLALNWAVTHLGHIQNAHRYSQGQQSARNTHRLDWISLSSLNDRAWGTIMKRWRYKIVCCHLAFEDNRTNCTYLIKQDDMWWFM